jgi:hypothetical protein
LGLPRSNDIVVRRLAYEILATRKRTAGADTDVGCHAARRFSALSKIVLHTIDLSALTVDESQGIPI